MKDNDENQTLTFETLAAATARVLERAAKNGGADNNGDHEDSTEQHQAHHRQHIDRGLRDLAAFEARARKRP